ncbi:MAG: hypothetical protein R3D32_08050 [Nitratireductor sp.]
MAGLRKSAILHTMGAMLAAIALSGCVGGTTYGTGVTQEEQTLQDMTNMFTLGQKRQKIDYSPRPDLIVPDNKQALVEPIDTAATTSNPDWPETPEQRIARVRAEAGEIDARTGDYSQEELRRAKEGIAIDDSGYSKQDFVPGQTDRDGNTILVRGDTPTRAKVLKAKEETRISVGAKRKYLTEPPVEYRIAAETAPQGEEAFTPEELAAREEEKKRLRNEGFRSLTSKN